MTRFNPQEKARIPIISLLVLFLIGSGVSAITIRVTGGWNLVITEADVDGPPGSDLRPEYESSPDEIRVRVHDQHFQLWEVVIRKNDMNWHPDLHLYIRRTSSGNGNPRRSAVIGGWNYQEISDFDQRWFWGWGNRNNIDAQLRLTGVSVNLPADTYTTVITYTAIDYF